VADRLARLAGLFAIDLSIFGYVSIRSRGIKEQEAIKRENLKREEVSRREYLQQINKVKNQALQLQMNPHFIFYAMNAIKNFLTGGREKYATIYLAKFAKLIRLIFEYSNARLISLESLLDFVRFISIWSSLDFKIESPVRLILVKALKVKTIY
jgi:hypothetical protein